MGNYVGSFVFLKSYFGTYVLLPAIY